MTRRIALVALVALSAAGCAERRYPWPDFQVSDDAWVPLPVPPRAPPVAAVPDAPAGLYGHSSRMPDPSWARSTAAGFRS